MRLEDIVGAAIAGNLGYDDQKRKVIVYGLGALFQMLLLLVIALAFGIMFRCLPECMLIFWGVGLLRRSTGGAHCETYLGCIMTSALSICLMALICRYQMWCLGGVACYIGIAISFLTAAIMFIRKVPVEAPNKPIRKPEKIRRLRIESAVTYMVYLAAAIAFLCAGRYSCTYSVCCVMLWISFTLSSTSGHLVRFMDRLSDSGRDS